MIARRALLILANNAIGASIGFFTLLLITRNFPPQALGLYAGAAALIAIPALVSSLGFPEAHIKRVNEGIDEGAANGTLFATKMVLTLAFVAVVVGGHLVWVELLGKGYRDVSVPVLGLVLSLYVLLSVRLVFDTVFRAHRHTARGESVMLVDTVATFFGIATGALVLLRLRGHDVPLSGFLDRVAGWLSVEAPASIEEAGLLLTAGYFVGRFTSLLYAMAQFLLHRYPIGRPSSALARSYWRFGLPVTIVGGLSILYASADRIFLLYFQEEIHVALYQVAYTLLAPLTVLGTALAVLLFPTISRLNARGAHHDVQATTNLSERYLCMALLPLTVLAIAFAEEALHILHDEYLDAAPVLRFLAVFFFFTVLGTPSRTLLAGTERLQTLTRLGLLNVVIVLSLNTLLVPPSIRGVPLANLGGTGAAFAAAVGGVISFFYVKHHLRSIVSRYFAPGVPRQLFAGAALAVLCWGAKALLGPVAFDRLWKLGVTGAVALLAWLGLLVLVREFRKADWLFVLDLIHPGRMVGYVVEELTPPKQAR